MVLEIELVCGVPQDAPDPFVVKPVYAMPFVSTNEWGSRPGQLGKQMPLQAMSLNA